MNSHSWTHQYGPTSKNIYSSALCGYWVQSRELAKCDDRLGIRHGGTTLEVRTNSFVTLSYGHVHMDTPALADQQNYSFISSV